jgi:hypothetical protein
MVGEHPPSLSNFVPVSGITRVRPERAGSGSSARADARTSHLPSRQDRIFVPSAGTGADGGDEAAGVVGATGAGAAVEGWSVTGDSGAHPARTMLSRLSGSTQRHRRDWQGPTCLPRTVTALVTGRAG